jgi:hypothetical protein
MYVMNYHVQALCSYFHGCSLPGPGGLGLQLQQLPRSRRLRRKPNRVNHILFQARKCGDVTLFARYPPAIESRRWQTPPRGSAQWQPEYQDHSCLVGHARVVCVPPPSPIVFL